MPGQKYHKVKRRLTVYTTFINNRDAPLIRLQGQWLLEFGFTAGSKIKVEGADGLLLITMAERCVVRYDPVQRNTGQRK